MSDILKGLSVYLEPFVPMVQYKNTFNVKRSQLRPHDPAWCDDDNVMDFGPTVEVGYPEADMSVFHIGAVITLYEELGPNNDFLLWVERNTSSGKPHGNLWVDPADPASFDKIREFLCD